MIKRQLDTMWKSFVLVEEIEQVKKNITDHRLLINITGGHLFLHNSRGCVFLSQMINILLDNFTSAMYSTNTRATESRRDASTVWRRQRDTAATTWRQLDAESQKRKEEAQTEEVSAPSAPSLLTSDPCGQIHPPDLFFRYITCLSYTCETQSNSCGRRWRRESSVSIQSQSDDAGGAERHKEQTGTVRDAQTHSTAGTVAITTHKEEEVMMGLRKSEGET